MTEKSRIKYNPVTQEIEIEGSEEFIREYFDRVQTLFKEMQQEVKREKRRKAKKVEVKTRAKRPKMKKERASAKGIKVKVMELIAKAGEQGISSEELQEKTGLSARQIWSVIYRAEKAGKVVKEKRGVYKIA